jgi:kynureninase
MHYENSEKFALNADREDVLGRFASFFHKPKGIYFCGNSLGLQPKSVQNHIHEVLSAWQEKGIEGFFEGENPWMDMAEKVSDKMASIVGGLKSEVIVMNTLTVNLHLMMHSFYRPTPQRYKILIESGAFPSDQYAVDSFLNNPEDAIIESPHDQILENIEQHKGELAMVLLGGLHYFTGELFSIEEIARATRNAGAIIGLDLAHAAGNVHLQLHQWEIDFAVWCNYKYLNGGPGAPGSAFVHEKHHREKNIARLEGWWGNHPGNRFLMRRKFTPAEGAAAWQLSTPSAIAFAPVMASLLIFEEAGIDKIVEKSRRLTGFLEFLIRPLEEKLNMKIITPEQRGAQLSIYIRENGKQLFSFLTDHGVTVDWREDNLTGGEKLGSGVIRVAPAPLYNTFHEVYQFYQILNKYSAL